MDTDSLIVYIKKRHLRRHCEKMSKQDSILQIMNQTDCYQKEKNEKVIALMKDELDGKIMKKFNVLRAKTYGYLTDRNDEDKRSKRHKKVCYKKKT